MRHGDGDGMFDERQYGAVRALGLDVNLEFDVEDFKRFIRTTEWPVVNGSADPAFHDFAPGEVFWLRLSHRSRTVGTQVLRVIETDDYVGMIRDHTLFFGSKPSGFKDFRMLVDYRMPRIGGRVIQLSGLYLRPEWRRVRTGDGMRLVAAWARLTHSFAARDLTPDWSVSLVEARVAKPHIIRDLYGYPHWVELFEAYIPFLDRHERTSLIWMSAGELNDAVDLERRRLDVAA